MNITLNGRTTGSLTSSATSSSSEVLRPAVLERALDRAVEILHGDDCARDRASRRAELTRRLAALDTELSNLADTAAKGGAVPVVLERLSRSDAERRAVAGELENLKAAAAVLAPIEPRVLRRTLRGYVDDWHAMIRGNVAEARRLFELVLRDRIRFRPVDGEDGAPSFELTVPIAFDRRNR
jgi:hypothetical protein